MKLTLSRAAVMVVLGLSAGCGRTTPQASQAPRYTIDVSVVRPIELTVDGSTVSSEDGKFGLVADHLPQVTRARLRDACGWHDVRFSVFDTTPPTPQNGWRGRISLEVEVPRTPQLTVWIDNRGGDGFSLQRGYTTWPVAADFHGSIRMDVLDCEDASDLVVGGQRAGRLPLAREVSKGEELPPQFLLAGDPQRCYEFQTRVYSTLGLAFGPKPKPQRLSGRKLHRLAGNVDYFLESAPEEISVMRFQPTPVETLSRGELVEVNCR